MVNTQLLLGRTRGDPWEPFCFLTVVNRKDWFTGFANYQLKRQEDLMQIPRGAVRRMRWGQDARRHWDTEQRQSRRCCQDLPSLHKIIQSLITINTVCCVDPIQQGSQLILETGVGERQLMFDGDEEFLPWLKRSSLVACICYPSFGTAVAFKPLDGILKAWSPPRGCSGEGMWHIYYGWHFEVIMAVCKYTREIFRILHLDSSFWSRLVTQYILLMSY